MLEAKRNELKQQLEVKNAVRRHIEQMRYINQLKQENLSHYNHNEVDVYRRQ